MLRTSSVHHQERFVQAVFADFGMWYYVRTTRHVQPVQSCSTSRINSSTHRSIHCDGNITAHCNKIHFNVPRCKHKTLFLHGWIYMTFTYFFCVFSLVKFKIWSKVSVSFLKYPKNRCRLFLYSLYRWRYSPKLFMCTLTGCFSYCCTDNSCSNKHL